MTVGELAHEVYEKHCKGKRGFPAAWIAWVMWARRSTGWMQPMVPAHMRGENR